jgi:hypothetical protein
VRAGAGLAWRGPAGAGRVGEAELGQAGGGSRPGPGGFRPLLAGTGCLIIADNVETPDAFGALLAGPVDKQMIDDRDYETWMSD